MADGMVKKTIMVKKGSSDDTGEKKKKNKLAKFSLKAAAKEMGPALAGGAAGAVATGIGMGIVSLVPPLAKQAAKGGATRLAVVTGTSLGVAAVGLMVYSKVATPKKALEAAPYVGAATVITSLAPFIAQSIVGTINGWMVKTVNGTVAPAPTTGAPPTGAQQQRGGGALGARPALTADQVLSAQQQQRVPSRNTWG